MATAKKQPAKQQPAKKKLTAEERAAMREYLKEGATGDGAGEMDAKIAAMAPPDRALAEKLRALIAKTAPSLAPKTWYGMPAWAKDDKVVCFFQAAAKFKTRYATLGFSDKAKLDEGGMWPTAYALVELDAARIAALVKRALG